MTSQFTFDFSRPMVLDGALATELEKKGCSFTDSPLWSATVLLESPEMIYDVHYNYLEAGARCMITASYQATPQGLMRENIPHKDALDLIAKSVEVAKKARADFINATHTTEPIYIAGSVGSYGAFLADGSEYTGTYNLPIDTLVEFHRERFETLINAGADLIAFETQATYTEIEALLKLLTMYPDAKAWVAFTVRDGQHLSDGTPIQKVAMLLNGCKQIIGYGPNCIPLRLCTSVLEELSKVAEKPLVIYPNSAEIFNTKTRQWEVDQTHCDTIPSLCKKWISLGARIIGGCCRTSPDDIRKLSEVIRGAQEN